VRDRFAGDIILNPVLISTLALLIVNDHILKEKYGGPITGKLSDVTGVIVFPLLLVSALEVARVASGRRPWNLQSRGLAACVIATGVVFTLAKTWSPATTFYRIGTGVAEWPEIAAYRLIRGDGLPGLPAAHLVRDPTDLIVLPLLAIPWWIGKQRINKINSTEPTTHQ
jgi:hypothetical protein